MIFPRSVNRISGSAHAFKCFTHPFQRYRNVPVTIHLFSQLCKWVSGCWTTLSWSMYQELRHWRKSIRRRFISMVNVLCRPSNAVVSHLKHSTGRDRDIILVPQPSDSPRDPLNWPLWRKDFIFLIFSSNSAIIGAWSFMLSPAYIAISQEFNIVRPINETLIAELQHSERTVWMVILHSRLGRFHHQWHCCQIRQTACLSRCESSYIIHIYLGNISKQLECFAGIPTNREFGSCAL
jgi:hypothetical protein